MENVSNAISVSLSKPTDSEAERRINDMVVRNPTDMDPSLTCNGLVIRRTSMLTGIERDVYIDGLTEGMLMRWMQGMLIQDALRGIEMEHREFIQTGIVAHEWGDAFPEFDDDDDWDDCEGGE